MYTSYYHSPVGELEISSDDTSIRSIQFVQAIKRPSPKLPESEFTPEIMYKCIEQLSEYFDGTRTVFDLSVQQDGTEFQQSVWRSICQIPFGKTITYKEQALRINKPEAIRAIASCNGKNNICIVVPCHRVVGSDGSLTGYAGDVWVKKWLLNHEKKLAQLMLF